MTVHFRLPFDSEPMGSTIPDEYPMSEGLGEWLKGKGLALREYQSSPEGSPFARMVVEPHDSVPEVLSFLDRVAAETTDAPIDVHQRAAIPALRAYIVSRTHRITRP